jgi:hypothetical protein
MGFLELNAQQIRPPKKQEHDQVMNKQIILRGCLSIAATFSLQAAAQAQAGVVQSAETTTVVGAPQVIDSYMKPTVVRTRETTDGDGNVSKTVEPIIQERHEKVIIPTIETSSTEVRSGGTSVATETRAVATTNTATAVKKVVHHPRHHRAYVAHHAQQSVSTRTTTIEQPITVERQERTTERDTLFERRDPALDQQ